MDGGVHGGTYKKKKGAWIRPDMMHVDSGVGTLMKVKLEVWFNGDSVIVQHIHSSGGVSTSIMVVEDMERRWIQSK